MRFIVWFILFSRYSILTLKLGLIFSISNQWKKITKIYILALNVHVSDRKKFWTNNVSIAKQAKHHKALLKLTIINKHKPPKILDSSIEFVRSIVDTANLFLCFILFCSEESNLNVWWLVHTVLFDCDTHPPLNVKCYFVYSLPGLAPKFSASWITVFRIVDIAFSFFFTKIDLLGLFKVYKKSLVFSSWKHGSKQIFPL